MAPNSINPSTSAAGQTISEHELGERLGLDRELLKKARKNAPENAFKRVRGAILWPLEEAVRFAASLGLTLDEKTAPVPETVTVTSLPGPSGKHFAGNPLLIKARRASGEVVVVRTRDSSKYRPLLFNGQPMSFPARQSEAGNWWVPTGREPRFPGRW